MKDALQRTITWLLSMFERGGPQVKKVAYLFVIVTGMGCLIADLAIERTLQTTWVAALGLLVGAVTGSYLGAKQIEKGKQ
jgi:type IV secretory pathway VirB2 component (pilin)